MGKESACNIGDAGDVDSIPGRGRSPGEGNGNPHEYSCLENPMDGGAGRATVHEVCELDTTEYTCVYHSPHHSPCSWDVQLTLRIQRFHERSVLIYHFGPAVVCSIWRYMPLTSEPMSCFLLLFSLSVASDSLRPQGL